ncbi:phage antirepressor KilAC domain-containing protein [Nitrosospira multiformis]|uniref:phage antirepressor KilAC domain-containing protein n=1 Tax=Nitrosospira multiformis TaxID=1231 RepID=UPI000D31613C
MALASDGVIFKRDGVWIPTQAHLDAGQFVVRTGVRHGFAFNQIRVTPKGSCLACQAVWWVVVDREKTSKCPETQSDALQLIISSFHTLA